jgi:hypothetical protein
MRTLLLTLLVALAASGCGMFLTDTNEITRVDARWSSDGLHVAVKRDYYDPGQAQGGGESVGGGVTTQLSDFLIGDGKPARTVRPANDPGVAALVRASMREGDHEVRLVEVERGFRALRDDVEVAAVSAGVATAELGRPAGQPVSVFALKSDSTLEVWAAASDTAPFTSRALGALPPPASGYGLLLLSQGPVLGVAAWDLDRNGYGDGQVAVWSETGPGRVLGTGRPLAVWSEGTSTRAIVEQGSKRGTEAGTYALIDGTSSQQLAGALDASSRPQNKSDPCGAAVFSADGTPMVAREEASAFRLTDGSTSFTVSRPGDQYVHQCFLIAEEGTARVHLVFTVSAGLALQKPTTLHDVVLEGGKVVARHEVDVTPDAIH